MIGQRPCPRCSAGRVTVWPWLFARHQAEACPSCGARVLAGRSAVSWILAVAAVFSLAGMLQSTTRSSALGRLLGTLLLLALWLGQAAAWNRLAPVQVVEEPPPARNWVNIGKAVAVAVLSVGLVLALVVLRARENRGP